METKAKYYEIKQDNKIKCLLCPVGCLLGEGKEGVCMGRYNKDGEMVVTNYGEAVSLSIDPIEKKPLYHFHPRSLILSTGPNGCNLRCKNCQNWNISQEKSPTGYVSPERMAELSTQNDSIGIAYTYTEPFMWFEYLCDTMPLVHQAGGKNVMVTNGYINREPLEELLPLIDAMNVDLKSMDDDFYRRICKGHLKEVQETITRAFESDVHLEVTSLLISDLNDSREHVTRLVDWIASVSPEIPLHISRYFPSYKMDRPITPIESLDMAYRIAIRKLDYVYVGNTHIEGTTDTLCPKCGETLISRNGYQTEVKRLKGAECGNCGAKINLVLHSSK
ncbi:MAG: AmmeMemoRadiSam system radical SAM enzyme [candidate division Zixibacteria bacterium]|nr:AmmeMemoRadiSam system radical SAM enzyme [candidate division Zixibacteria bacterium]